MGFAALLAIRTLAQRPGSRALLVQCADAAREGGAPYGPGLLALGLDPDRIGLAQVRTAADALRVVDEALRSGAVAAVVADLDHAPQLDLSVTRRFNLSAAPAGALAVMVTRNLSATSAALTRWRVAPAVSRGRRRRLGAPAFQLSLTRNRMGPVGDWTLEWDLDDRLFRSVPPLSAPVARPAVDRPDPAWIAGPGLAPGPHRQAG
jgi:protein ImuA